MFKFINKLGLASLALLVSCLSVSAIKTDKHIVLAKNNTLVVDSRFTSLSVAKWILEAQALDRALPPGQPLYAVISSPGGDVSAGLELIDNLNALGREIHSVTLFSASMGFHLAQSVSGNRYISPNGTLMSHKARGGFEGEFSGQLDNRYQFFLRILQKLDERVISRANGRLTMQKYKDLYENELWCGGADCGDLGLIDAMAVVSCDVSLKGLKVVTAVIEYRGLQVVVEVIKAACPTNTVTFNAVARINGTQVNVKDLDKLAKQLTLSPTQAFELVNLIEKKLNEISPTKSPKL